MTHLSNLGLMLASCLSAILRCLRADNGQSQVSESDIKVLHSEEDEYFKVWTRKTIVAATAIHHDTLRGVS